MTIGEWLSQNAAAIFISTLASLLISRYYFNKANRDGVLTTVIFPIVKILERGTYNRKNYEELFSINSSYAIKYLRKKERNKLLALLSSYRTVCRYTKEAADTDCVMSYFSQKIKEFGINPKPCAERDEEGDLLFYDFPPDYNHLQNYVYEVISSYEFTQSPADCAKRIANEFQRYTKEYYTDKNIEFFSDCSITEVIGKSHVSREWDEKFALVEKCRAEFLKLPISQKARDIIRESNINEYNNKNFAQKIIARMREIKNSKYSSIYVVFCLIEQSVFLEALKDFSPRIQNEKLSLYVYIIGGLISILLLLWAIAIMEKRARRQIEEDALTQIRKNQIPAPKKDILIECATTIGYMGPLLCLATWASYFDVFLKLKWGLIVLVHILGIVVPLIFNRKK